MVPDVRLIAVPSVDFDTFLGLSQQALGRNPAAAGDASPRNLSDTERFIGCLVSMQCPAEHPGLFPHLLTHVSFSILVAADDRDMFDIIQIASGMPFVVTDTIMRGVQLAVITGDLNQWRDAVKSGSSLRKEFNVRAFFNRVMNLFVDAGLNAWTEFKKTDFHDQTFLLTDAR